MAKLTNYQNAVISEQKLRDYLLSPTHPIGKYKAKFLEQAGYERKKWKILEKDLREQHLTKEAKKVDKNDFGQKFVIKAPLTGPNGATIAVTTVWIVLNNENFPRFITLIPGE